MGLIVGDKNTPEDKDTLERVRERKRPEWRGREEILGSDKPTEKTHHTAVRPSQKKWICVIVGLFASIECIFF